MENILSIIESAADELTRNERKNKGKKKNYTESELKDMLREQEMQKESNRDGLEKKLNDICEKTQREFNISHITIGMMQKVALMISTEISNETITSLENVERSGGVVKTLHEEATKIQLIENYEAMLDGRKPPHANVPFFSESSKLIASSPEIALAMNIINSETESDKKAKDIVKDINTDNADEIAEELTEVTNSEEYRLEERHRAEVAGKSLQKTEDPEEQRFLCEDIEGQEAAIRCRVEPENSKNLIILIHRYMTKLNLKTTSSSRIVSDIRLNIMSNKQLTAEQRVHLSQMLDEFERENNPQKLLEFFADRIAELNPHITKEQALELAKQAAKIDMDPSRVTADSLKPQGRLVYVNDKEYIEYCDVINEVERLKTGSEEFDWERFSKINEASPDLYAMSLAYVRKTTRESGNIQNIAKTQGLIDKYVEEEKDFIKNDVMYVGMEKKENPNLEGMYRTFCDDALHGPQDLDKLKNSKIEFLRKLDFLSQEEKDEEIRRIEQLQSADDIVAYCVAGIASIKEGQGKTVDIDALEASMRHAKEIPAEKEPQERQKRERKAETARQIVRAKTSTDANKREMYERFISTMDMLSHVKRDASMELDTELLDYYRENDPDTYRVLSDKYRQCQNISLNNAMQKRLNDEMHATKKHERKLETTLDMLEHVKEDEILELDTALLDYYKAHNPESYQMLCDKYSQCKNSSLNDAIQKRLDEERYSEKKFELILVGDSNENELQATGKGAKPTILEVAEEVVEDVVSTIAEPDAFMRKAAPEDDERDDR